MRWLLAVTLLWMVGCTSDGASPGNGAGMFAPASLRIHPVFTSVADWTGDKRPDGVEVLVELSDQFGDPCKGAGTFVFELYSFQPGAPDPRGARIQDPWLGEVDSVKAQKLRWNRTSRCYTFRLACSGLRSDGSYVLTATFNSPGQPRHFDRLVLGAVGSLRP